MRLPVNRAAGYRGAKLECPVSQCRRAGNVVLVAPLLTRLESRVIAATSATSEVLGDSAYGTGDARAALADAGHVAVIKPGPLRPAVTGGFTVDEQARTVTCPNGIIRPITASRTVTFGAACHDCPLRGQCTTSKTGRTLNLHQHDALLRQARRDWATNPGLREIYRRHRPMVERSTHHRPRREGKLVVQHHAVTTAATRPPETPSPSPAASTPPNP